MKRSIMAFFVVLLVMMMYPLKLVVAETNSPFTLFVTAASPFEGQIDRTLNTKIKILFNRNIKAGADVGNIQLNNGATIDTAIEGNVLTITPKNLLNSNTNYTLTVPATAITDSETGSLTLNQQYTLKFTTVMTRPNELFTLGGSDVDHVYFDGNSIEINGSLPPMSIEIPANGSGQGIQTTIPDMTTIPTNIPAGPSGYTGPTGPPEWYKPWSGAAKAYVGIVSDLGAFDATIPVLKDMVKDTSGEYYVPIMITKSSMTSSTLKISGIINNPNNATLKTGAIAVKIVMDNGEFPIYQLNSAGVKEARAIPTMSSLGHPALIVNFHQDGHQNDANSSVTPDFSTFTNLMNMEKGISFYRKITIPATATSQEIVLEGTITFPPGLDVFTDREDIINLHKAIYFYIDPNKNELQYGINTAAMTFLAGKDATLKIKGFADALKAGDLTQENIMQQIDITGYQNLNATNVTDISRMSQFEVNESVSLPTIQYEPTLDTLTVPVNHLSIYKFSLKQPTTTLPNINNYTKMTPITATTNIALSKEWKITFNATIDQTSLTQDAVQVFEIDGANVKKFDVQAIVENGKILVMKHNTQFSANKQYKVYVNPTIKNSNGKALSKGVMFEFTTYQ